MSDDKDIEIARLRAEVHRLTAERDTWKDEAELKGAAMNSRASPLLRSQSLAKRVRIRIVVETEHEEALRRQTVSGGFNKGRLLQEVEEFLIDYFNEAERHEDRRIVKLACEAKKA